MLKEPKYLSTILHHIYTSSSPSVIQILEENRNVKNWNFYFFLLCLCHAMIKILENYRIFSNNWHCRLMRFNVSISASLIQVRFYFQTIVPIKKPKLKFFHSKNSRRFCSKEKMEILWRNLSI